VGGRHHVVMSHFIQRCVYAAAGVTKQQATAAGLTCSKQQRACRRLAAQSKAAVLPQYMSDTDPLLAWQRLEFESWLHPPSLDAYEGAPAAPSPASWRSRAALCGGLRAAVRAAVRASRVFGYHHASVPRSLFSRNSSPLEVHSKILLPWRQQAFPDSATHADT
jgi:hypothetical protein